jgi:nucleotide-binding universal stress UspA family protein
VESATIASEGAAGETGDKRLKKDAIGFPDGLAIGLDSTAPAYSLAAVIGSVVIAVGVTAPGNLLLAFVPMFVIAAAFYYMNRADQDCGTDAGVKAAAALIPELPTNALLSMGAEHDARAIVVGTYGEHPIKGAILGSTP